jgi:uncharacterized protein YegP (UPF0339 family)
MVFHIYQDVRNEWRWYLAAPNGARLAVSGEGYARRGECALAIKRLVAELHVAAAAPMVNDHIGPLSNGTTSGAYASALAR